MATARETIDLLMDSLDARYSTRRMFGEYCLYRDALPIALVCDDTLFVKDTPAGREAITLARDPTLGTPYPGARPHLPITPDEWDDADWLRGVLQATASALPPPKPRRRKQRS